MTVAFVIGNGVSRLGVPLATLNIYGKIYGCNALYRDYTPDCLVATDKPIATKIQESGYSMKHKFYTRKPINDLGGYKLPEPYYGYSSGPAALGLAVIDQPQTVYIVGFDMGPDKNKKINNLYVNTEFYRNSDHPPIYTGNWIRQMSSVFTDFPKIKFVRIYGETTARINEFDKHKNLRHENLGVFLDRINNQKGF